MSDSAVQDPRRLLWLCRRGTKELDVLLERYVHGPYSAATPEQKDAFARLLQLPDERLAEYLFGHATPEDPQLASLAHLIGNRRPGAASTPSSADRVGRAGSGDSRGPRSG